jgi:hypothetical protein
MPRLFSLLDTEADSQRFFAACRDRTVFHAKARPGRFRHLIEIGQIDAFLRSSHIPAPFINVLKDGIQFPAEQWAEWRTSARGTVFVAAPEKVLALYDQGATIILNGAHDSIHPISAECRKLSEELGFKVGANIYITPPHSQGVLTHQDDHDELNLQIWGEKDWMVYLPDAPPLQFRTCPGDMLYVPRPIRHHATCTDRPSVHITLGFYPLYPADLIRELAAIANDDPRCQKPFGPEADDREFADLVMQLVRDNPARALARRQLDLRAERDPVLWQGRFLDMLQVVDLKPGSVVQRRSEIESRVSRKGFDVEVSFVGRRFTVPVFLQPTLDRLLEPTPVAVRDLPGMLTEAGKVEFTSTFVKSGLVAISSV